MAEDRGSIGFFSPYRPPVAQDIYSCPLPETHEQSEGLHESDECRMTDGKSCNYNGQAIPPAALKAMLGRPKLASVGTDADVDSGRLSGIVFISERRDGLETLHIALRLPDSVEVFSFAEVYDTFDGVRMEDSGCFAQDYLVYVTTKDPASESRQPWTAVYKTHLKTGKTDRLTPPSQADLSPSVSPSGKRIAVASFEKKGGWHGEGEDLKTDIFVMNVEEPYERALLIEDGGWPTWGSDRIIFFHRKSEGEWGIYRITRVDRKIKTIHCVTPQGINAVTPVAIGLNFVAAAVTREDIQLTEFKDTCERGHYRHIEIFNNSGKTVLEVTNKINPKANHYNPFVVVDRDGNKRIGYNCCKDNPFMSGEKASKGIVDIKSPRDDVGLFRVSGVFPAFSADGTKLAFLDNNSSEIWVADSGGLRLVFQVRRDKAYCPEWNPKTEWLYFCLGESLDTTARMHICAIPNVPQGHAVYRQLTKSFNNAFPSVDPTGRKLVFRSSRDPKGVEMGYKNLYIMEDAEVGEYGEGIITQLTYGDWIDTRCKWSPRGDWIVFLSNRDKPQNTAREDMEHDSEHFVVYLVKPDDPSVLMRVLASGSDFAIHINHPFFSPDGRSIVVTADLAAVSVDPMSLPVYLRSARPYADIFTVDIDSDLTKFKRITHSRFENAAGTWSTFTTKGTIAEILMNVHGGH